MAKGNRYLLKHTNANPTLIVNPLNVQVANLISPPSDLGEDLNSNYRQRFHIRNFRTEVSIVPQAEQNDYEGYTSVAMDLWFVVCSPEIAETIELNGLGPSNQYWLQQDFILKKWIRRYWLAGGDTESATGAYAFNPRPLFAGKVRLRSITLRERQNLYMFMQQRELNGPTGSVSYAHSHTSLYRWREITLS